MSGEALPVSVLFEKNKVKMRVKRYLSKNRVTVL